MFNTEHTILWIAGLMPNKVYRLMTCKIIGLDLFFCSDKPVININEIQDFIDIKSLALKLLDNKRKTQQLFF